MKKVVSLLLALIMALSLVACGEKKGETDDNTVPYKIGIVTGSVSQSEDDRRGAEAFQALYGEDMVKLAIYPDNFTEELETTIQTIVNLADDADMKAIIVNQSVPGTTEAFRKINEEFGRIMQLMFRGGKARLELTDEAHPLEGGVEMYLQLPGKKRQPLSFMAYRPAPFCFVDEIDAALDDANVERYSRMIGEYKKKTQFIVISHRKKTMEFADTLQGVTMAEKGVSSLITVKMKDYVE